MARIKRRTFLARMAGGAGTIIVGPDLVRLLGAPSDSRVVEAASTPITGGTFGAPARYDAYATPPPPATPTDHFIYGDTYFTAWCPAWTDPTGDLLTLTDDTYHWNHMIADGLGSDLMLGRFTGNPNQMASFHGSDVNLMFDRSEMWPNHPYGTGYGGNAESGFDNFGFPQNGPYTWKANSLTCISGVLYMIVSRAASNGPIPPNQGWSQGVTIIKSTDHGATWSNPFGYPTGSLNDPNGASPQWNSAINAYDSMFSGPNFGVPAFVHYGQDGAAPNNASSMPERPDLYVYMASLDTYANQGVRLGRVLRSQIANLDATQWQFVQGLDQNGNPTSWGPDTNGTYGVSIFNPPVYGGLLGPVLIEYIVPLQRYILVNYEQRYSDGAWSTFQFYEGPAVWGPWTLFTSQTLDADGLYNIAIANKFIGADGLTMPVFAAGNTNTYVDPPSTTKYCLYSVPLTLSTAVSSLPAPWGHRDIGSAGTPGNATYSGGTFMVTGTATGTDIGGSADAFHYAEQFTGASSFQPTLGNGQIIARVDNGITFPGGKAGLMLRDGVGADAAFIALLLTATGVVLEYRTMQGASATTTAVSAQAPYWFKLTRQRGDTTGDTFAAYVSLDGVAWGSPVGGGALTFKAANVMYVGLVATGASVTHHVDNVVVTASPGFALPAPWTDTDIGSVGTAGSSTWDTGLFSVAGSGAGIRGTADAFHFAYQPWTGGGKVQIFGGPVNFINAVGGGKAGFMIRDGVGAGARYAALLVGVDAAGNPQVTFQYRAAVGGGTTVVARATGVATGGLWLDLVKDAAGNFTAYQSPDGITWTIVGVTITIASMPTNVNVGVVVTSESAGQINNGSVNTPVVASF